MYGGEGKVKIWDLTLPSGTTSQAEAEEEGRTQFIPCLICICKFITILKKWKMQKYIKYHNFIWFQYFIYTQIKIYCFLTSWL